MCRRLSTYMQMLMQAIDTQPFGPKKTKLVLLQDVTSQLKKGLLYLINTFPQPPLESIISIIVYLHY